MSQAGAHLESEVACHDGLGTDCYLKALIVERTAVAPVVIDTGDGVVEGLQSEQVCCVVVEVVEVDSYAVVQQCCFQADVELAGLLPGDALVADVVKDGGGGAPEVLADTEGGACSVVVDVVVAADVIAGLQQQVVDALGLREPSLVADHPS